VTTDVKEKSVERGVSGAKDNRASSTPADCALRILPVAYLVVCSGTCDVK